MSLLKKLNRRRCKLLWKMAKHTRPNAELLRYIGNRWRLYRHDRETDTRVPHPANAMLELGNVCNLRCVTCPRVYEYGRRMDKGFMAKEDAFSIIDELLPYLDSIGLTGLGETVMYPHLADVVEHIKRKKRSVVTTISTNAHFDGYMERIRPCLPFIDNIQFSVDGVGEVYETIRPGTDFAVVSRNIEETMKWGPDAVYMLNFVISDKNYRDMARVLRFAREKGIRYVNYNIMSISSMPHMERGYYGFYRSEEYRQAREELLREAGRYPDMEVTGLEEAGANGFRNCPFPWEYPYITWDGYYVPCCGKPFPKLLNFGNVLTDGGVMAVLNSRKAQAFRKRWQENKAPAFCHNCHFVDF